MDDLLRAMMARRAKIVIPPKPESKDDNPPFDEFTENIGYHWRRRERLALLRPKAVAHKPERSVLAAIKRWLAKISYFETRRISVGQMRNNTGVVINFGGTLGQSDIVITPHAGQPFERQIHVECKRPGIVIDGKKVQRAGKQSDAQKAFQDRMESIGDKYVVVTSVTELREFLVTLGFAQLPPAPRAKKGAQT